MAHVSTEIYNPEWHVQFFPILLCYNIAIIISWKAFFKSVTEILSNLPFLSRQPLYAGLNTLAKLFYHLTIEVTTYSNWVILKLILTVERFTSCLYFSLKLVVNGEDEWIRVCCGLIKFCTKSNGLPERFCILTLKLFTIL